MEDPEEQAASLEGPAIFGNRKEVFASFRALIAADGDGE